MRIGLLSDTHDNLQGVQAAVGIFRREGVTHLLHCGDVCGPSIVEALEGFSVTFAQGNVDRLPALGMAVKTLQGPGRLARWHRLVLGGVSVALLHGDDLGLQLKLTQSGDYGYVFCGHTHRRGDTRVGRTRVINPGALGGTRRESRSICIVDLSKGDARFIELGF
jgi:putative phosphoesterase